MHVRLGIFFGLCQTRSARRPGTSTLSVRLSLDRYWSPGSNGGKCISFTRLLLVRTDWRCFVLMLHPPGRFKWLYWCVCERVWMCVRECTYARVCVFVCTFLCMCVHIILFMFGLRGILFLSLTSFFFSSPNLFFFYPFFFLLIFYLFI